MPGGGSSVIRGSPFSIPCLPSPFPQPPIHSHSFPSHPPVTVHWHTSCPTPGTVFPRALLPQPPSPAHPCQESPPAFLPGLPFSRFLLSQLLSGIPPSILLPASLAAFPLHVLSGRPLEPGSSYEAPRRSFSQNYYVHVRSSAIQEISQRRPRCPSGSERSCFCDSDRRAMT